MYIDKAAMLEMDISMAELELMVASQPWKYVLSPHLKRQL